MIRGITPMNGGEANGRTGDAVSRAIDGRSPHA
jgi:hypothetical protein